MSRALYIDAFSGISGDMTLGALLALGLPLERLRAELARLAIGGYRLEAERRQVNGIEATKLDVVLAGDQETAGHHHTHFSEIRKTISGSDLQPAVRDRALAIFTKLAIAEGKVHGKKPDDVAFHEVGAIDSIVDIVGTAIGMEELGIEKVYVSELPLGSGFVDCQHGTMPVPAPATVELVEGFPVRYGEGEGELVTPTGAAVVAALARPGKPAGFVPRRVGYGAGTRALSDRPNLLRLVLGEVDERTEAEALSVLESNIDDSNPEIYEHVAALLFAAGAKDVWLQPVVMKKGRPAVVLSVLGATALCETLAGIVMRETSSLGVRTYAVSRFEATREERLVETPYGTIPVKVSRAPDGTPNIAPEYEACRRAAIEHNVALKQVYAAATAACG